MFVHFTPHVLFRKKKEIVKTEQPNSLTELRARVLHKRKNEPEIKKKRLESEGERNLHKLLKNNFLVKWFVRARAQGCWRLLTNQVLCKTTE